MEERNVLAWTLAVVVLTVGLGLVAAAAPELMAGWRTVTRAFIVAPLTLVLMTIVLSL